MIVVTGGAGFIGSAIVWQLNNSGRDDVLIVDELGNDEKWKNLLGLKYSDFINKDNFIDYVEKDKLPKITSIIHMGANSSTTETDADFLLRNNYEYTKNLSLFSLKHDIRFIYASSAATYGDGSIGFEDNESVCGGLRPLNMYGYSKYLFDFYAFKNNLFDKMAGIKYFNVFGPNEYHKGEMRSVVHKAFEQIKLNGKVKLFKSRNPKYKDGEQLRDFIYVKDAVDMTLFFHENPNVNGLFNVGAGKARTWNDLVSAIFKAMGLKVNIEYIDLPDHLAEKYQYFTQASLDKIKKAGYNRPISTLEEGVFDYVKNYLLGKKYLAI